MSSRVTDESDHVDELVAAWRRERPEIDVAPMEIVARVSRLARLFERVTGEVFHRFGLNEPQFSTLAALRRSGPPFRLSPTEISQSLLISSGTGTHRLERLTDLGLVSREDDPTDGRGRLVLLTDRGRELIDEVFVAHAEAQRRLVAGLTAAERAAFTATARKLLLALEGGNDA